MVYFYTAVYGDHIVLPEFDTGGFEFKCYTDRKLESQTWTIVDRPGDLALSPRGQAKLVKLFPPPISSGQPDDISIWLDASITVTDIHEMVRVCTAAIENHDVAFFRHPERADIYDEARASMRMPKYARLPLIAQVEAYRADGLPADAGLWAAGVIVRKHTAACIQFERDWWEENKKWSLQDQLSLPYVLWRHGVVPGVIPGSVYGTAFHAWTPIADPAPPPPLVQSGDPNTISVVTATHDTRWLADCWKSLQAQSHQAFEWVVSVNSKTGRRALVEQLAHDVRAIVGADPRVAILKDFAPFSHVGQRKAFAFGAAAGFACVEFDHDDILTPDALAEIVAAFDDPDTGFVYSDWADFVEGDPTLQGNLTYRSHLRPGWSHNGFTFYDAEVAGIRPGTYDCVSSLPATAHKVSHIHTAPNHVRAWRKSVYEKLGGHNLDYAIADDHELILRTYLETRFKHIAKPLYLYRITGENTWARNVDKIQAVSAQLRYEYLERLVLRECELLDVPAVELGGGIDPRAGWTACDLQDAPIIADLRTRWPFEDGSVGAFRASDLLEHLPDKLHTMSEIHRCLRPGGWLLSMTPSAEGIGAWMDPTHLSYWVAPSFWYYTRPTSARYIRNATMLFHEVHLDTIPINVQGVNVPYVRADLVKR